MSKKAKPLVRASKKIRKAMRKNPLVTASIVAIGGLATAAVRSQSLRDRTKKLTGSMVEKLRLRKGRDTNGQSEHRAAS
jgi:hypothetical protein